LANALSELGKWHRYSQEMLGSDTYQVQLSAEAIGQFLNLVETLTDQHLIPDSEEGITWNFTASGEYSVKSAYSALFEGMARSPHHQSIWECWAPLKCKVFPCLAAG
jgi:hypothetical protein